jgi:hydroxypyruvate isomerase
MNLQLRWDMYHTQQSEAEQLKKIRPCKALVGPVGEGGEAT